MGCGASASKARYGVDVQRAAEGEHVASPVPRDGAVQPQVPVSPTLKVEEVWEDQELPRAGCVWWATHAEWIRRRAAEILAAYNFFFEHIGLRKGWRTAPIARDEVQAPFQAAAEVVTVVRARIDEQKGGGVVLRQLEGSSMDFLWGWKPDRPPSSCGEALEDFFRGLCFATLSDGHGLVEGLDAATVEHYVSSHPIIVLCRANLSPKAASSGVLLDPPIVLPDATVASSGGDGEASAGAPAVTAGAAAEAAAEGAECAADAAAEAAADAAPSSQPAALDGGAGGEGDLLSAQSFSASG